MTAPEQTNPAGSRPVPTYPTSLGTSNATTISLLGQNLASDLMGKVGFGELAFWLVTTRRPTPSEVRVFEACLVALADHGFTPTAIAARLTYLSAPDSLQGALASGLLGGGSRFLGVTEDAGQFLAKVLAGVVEQGGTLPGNTDADNDAWDALALSAVREARAAHRFVPGLGHPNHKDGDPRTPVMLAIAEEEGLRGPHLRLFEAIGRVHPQVLGRTLPLNGAGVVGAVSRCWPGPPACWGNWPRRTAARSAWTSTCRSTGTPPTCPRMARTPSGPSRTEVTAVAGPSQNPPGPVTHSDSTVTIPSGTGTPAAPGHQRHRSSTAVRRRSLHGRTGRGHRVDPPPVLLPGQ